MTARPAGMSGQPQVGGTVALRHRGSPSYSIGVVTAWEPGEHFAQSFTLGIDPGHPTTLDVRFSDWPHLLDRYRAMS